MAYIGKSPGTGVRNRFIYTATASQTTFSGSDDHSRTLSYTDAEFTDVFLNGVKLDKSDYTATSGTSIVLGSGATAGDNLEVLAFDTFSVFSGEFSQDVTIGADLTVDTSTLVVDSANNRVGIGTSSPSYTLDTLGSGAVVAQFKRDASGGASGGIRVGNNDKQFTFYADNSNGLTIYDGSSERLAIDTSGRLGIGVSSPVIPIQLNNYGGLDGNANQLIISNNTYYSSGDKAVKSGFSTRIDLTNQDGSIRFLNTSASSSANAAITLEERMRITADGDIQFPISTNAMGIFADNIGEVGSGNFALQVSNTAQSALKPFGIRAEDIRFATGSSERMRVTDNGITFNGDTAAANALDDYEEGTWTPTVSQGTISPSSAKYIKIGSVVHLIAIISTFSDTTSSGAITIGGLPFTTSGATANSIMHRFVNAGRPAISNYVPDASTNMYLYGSTDNADYTLLQHNHLTSTNAAFFINLTYRTS